MTYKLSKLGHTDLVFISKLGLWMQDYKSQRVAVMLLCTLVNEGRTEPPPGQNPLGQTPSTSLVGLNPLRQNRPRTEPPR